MKFYHDEVTVEMGQILLSHICVVRSTRTILILECDMHSKYAEIVFYTGSDQAGPEVGVGTGEYTLKADRSTARATVITLPRRTKGWSVEATAARYTVRIAAWKTPRRYSSVVWHETDDQYAAAVRIMDKEAAERSKRVTKDL